MRLKEIRLKRGVSQQEIADSLGLARNTVSGYETGVSEPSIENLIKLADILDVSVDTLLGHDANIVDLNLLDENQKIVISKIYKELTETNVAKVLGYIDNLNNK